MVGRGGWRSYSDVLMMVIVLAPLWSGVLVGLVAGWWITRPSARFWRQQNRRWKSK